MTFSVFESRQPQPVEAVRGESVAVSLSGLRKNFGSGPDAVRAVDGIDLTIADGEFFCLLGPSGSGKTTLVRLIAGFERPTSGRIALGDTDVTRRPPFRRDVNTVSQDHPLFPHLSVQENVEYGLRVKGVSRAERAERALQALATVRLTGFGERRTSRLSGSQRQRVALARALVNRPRALLLDEPLAALDLTLREQLQLELKAIQAQVGITFLLLTRDPAEALTLSDRVAVLNRGRIEQLGSPTEVYERPASAFVAGFVGTSNLLLPDVAARLVGQMATFSLRPEKIRLAEPSYQPQAEEAVADGRVSEVAYTGSSSRIVVAVADGPELTVLRANNNGPAVVAARPGDAVRLVWGRRHAVRLPEDAETAVATTKPADLDPPSP